MTIKSFFRNSVHILQSNNTSYLVHQRKYVTNPYVKIRNIKCYTCIKVSSRNLFLPDIAIFDLFVSCAIWMEWMKLIFQIIFNLIFIPDEFMLENGPQIRKWNIQVY